MKPGVISESESKSRGKEVVLKSSLMTPAVMSNKHVGLSAAGCSQQATAGGQASQPLPPAGQPHAGREDRYISTDKRNAPSRDGASNRAPSFSAVNHNKPHPTRLQLLCFKIRRSWIFKKIAQCLTEKELCRLQLLDKYFYDVQVPRLMKKCTLTLEKSRLHFLNQDYIILFDLLNVTKRKRKVYAEPDIWPLQSQLGPVESESGINYLNLWNQQSLEINGKIYMTGGAIAGTRSYLKTTTVLDENTWEFKAGLADMHHARDAHGMISWKNRYIIVVGSWHVDSSTRTCEIYDIKHNQWHLLPDLNEGTCAPGLIIVGDRYLYKLGGTTDISKVEMLDLHKIDLRPEQVDKQAEKARARQMKNNYDTFMCFSDYSSDFDTGLYAEQGPVLPMHPDVEMDNQEAGADAELNDLGMTSNENLWITITTCNKMGRKATINRCLLYPLRPYPLECDQFLVLGCHFGRSEAPFCYDTTKNKYVKFQKQDVFVDMYRSNDILRFDKSFVYIRPFVKVGEPSEAVKVYKYYLEKTKQDLNKVIKFEENGPDRSLERGPSSMS